MKGLGSWSWAVLAGVLAVPGFMFYQWRARLDTTNRQQMSQKVRKRLPEGQGLFSDSPSRGRLNNPMTEASKQSERETLAIAAPMPSLSDESAASVEQSTPTVQPNASPEGSQYSAPAGAQPAAPRRDPTLSPYDMLRLQQAELEKSAAQGGVVRAAVKRIQAKREPPVENDISLQGIISIDGRNKAIVNGETVGEGDMVGAAKVLRITSQSVIFIHKNRRFTKTIGR
ncbi:MAG: hypothetical protein HY921_01130 [Elusimicrobia bacterium]|nr:hypothetical protein [Elusimicrobiota bacterium]